MAASDDVPPPTTARPKYLGPAPPPYPRPPTSPEPELRGDRRWRTGHLLVAAGFAFAVGAGTVALSDGPDEAPAHAARAAREIARFSGTGPQATPAFTVDGAWELQWQSDSEVVLSVYRAIDGVRTGMPSKMAGGSGSALQPDPGSYLVEVMATGTWTITVVQPR